MLKTVFYNHSLHLEVRPKYSATRLLFSFLFSMFRDAVKHCFMFDLLYRQISVSLRNKNFHAHSENIEIYKYILKNQENFMIRSVKDKIRRL